MARARSPPGSADRYGMDFRVAKFITGATFFDKTTGGEHGLEVAGLESYLPEGLSAYKSDGVVIILNRLLSC